MNAEDLTRELIQRRLTPEEWNASMADIPGPSATRFLGLYTEYENSSWDEAELLRRAAAYLAEGS